MTDQHNRPVLQDSRVRLRAPVAADVQARLALGRSADILRGYGVDASEMGPYTQGDAEAWVADLNIDAHRFVIENENTLAGAIFLQSIDDRDKHAQLAVGLLDEAKLGQGVGTAAIKLLLAHAFATLGLHRVALRVLDDNRRAIACYRKTGFIKEGRLRDNAWVAGRWQDDIIMGLLAQDWRP